MFQSKSRRFRRRPNGRGRSSHMNGHSQSRMRTSPFSNNQTRNNFRPTQSPEKSLEKYTALAQEAMTSGDITLRENYLQHADHFSRIIEDKNKNRDQNKTNISAKPTNDEKNLSDNAGVDLENPTKDLGNVTKDTDPGNVTKDKE